MEKNSKTQISGTESGRKKFDSTFFALVLSGQFISIVLTTLNSFNRVSAWPHRLDEARRFLSMHKVTDVFQCCHEPWRFFLLLLDIYKHVAVGRCPSLKGVFKSLLRKKWNSRRKLHLFKSTINGSVEKVQNFKIKSSF